MTLSLTLNTSPPLHWQGQKILGCLCRMLEPTPPCAKNKLNVQFEHIFTEAFNYNQHHKYFGSKIQTLVHSPSSLALLCFLMQLSYAILCFLMLSWALMHSFVLLHSLALLQSLKLSCSLLHSLLSHLEHSSGKSQVKFPR